MCTAHSHFIHSEGNCLCGAFQDGQYCDKRSLKYIDRYPPLFKTASKITNEECCKKPQDCNKIPDDWKK